MHFRTASEVTRLAVVQILATVCRFSSAGPDLAVGMVGNLPNSLLRIPYRRMDAECGGRVFFFERASSSVSSDITSDVFPVYSASFLSVSVLPVSDPSAFGRSTVAHIWSTASRLVFVRRDDWVVATEPPLGARSPLGRVKARQRRLPAGESGLPLQGSGPRELRCHPHDRSSFWLG